MIDIIEKTAWQTIKDLPARFVKLIWKLVSRKGVILAVTILLIRTDVFPEEAKAYLYGFIVLIVLFGIEGLKFLKDLKK